MKTAKNILLEIPIGILALSMLVIAIPIFIIVGPVLILQEQKFIKDYKEYLRSIDGSNFLCYNNRKKGRTYIEEQIIPNLPSKVEILFLDGQNIVSGKYEKKYMSRAFYNFSNYTRFPQLLKIRDGKAIDCSLNGELFRCINQGADKSVIDRKINDFFQIKEESES